MFGRIDKANTMVFLLEKSKARSQSPILSSRKPTSWLIVLLRCSEQGAMSLDGLG
jgi:hypothetical protein